MRRIKGGVASIALGLAVALSFTANASAQSWMNLRTGVASGYNEGAIKQTSDGGYVVSGNYSDGTSGYASVTKLDANGDVSWQKGVVSKGALALDITSNGQIVLLADNYDWTTWIGILNADGTLASQTTINTYATQLKVSGNYAYMTDGYNIIKLNLTDFTATSALLGLTNGYECTGINVDGSGNIYITGAITSGNGADGVIIKLDSSLNLINFKTLALSGYGIWIYDVAFASDGILLTGSVGSASNEDDVYLVKLTDMSTVKYQRRLAGAYTDWCNSIATNGSFHFVGCSTRSFNTINDSYDFLVIKYHDTSSSISVDYRRIYQTPFKEESYAMTATSDGGVGIAGLHGWSGNSLLIKTESDLSVTAKDHGGNTMTNPYVTAVTLTNSSVSATLGSYSPDSYGSSTVTQSTPTETLVDIGGGLERIAN